MCNGGVQDGSSQLAMDAGRPQRLGYDLLTGRLAHDVTKELEGPF